MNWLDYFLIASSVPFWVYGFYKLSWRIRFRRKARITKSGIVVFKIKGDNT